MTQGSGGAERRKQRRVAMKCPVRVQGRDADGKTWEEMSTCEDASAGGVGLKLSRPVVMGQVLHLSMPLPAKFRQYDLTDPHDAQTVRTALALHRLGPAARASSRS